MSLNFPQSNGQPLRLDKRQEEIAFTRTQFRFTEELKVPPDQANQ